MMLASKAFDPMIPTDFFAFHALEILKTFIQEDLSMLSFICYFFPSVISLRIFESLTKTSLTLKQCIFRFCTNAFFVNFTCVAIKKLILHTANEPLLSTSGDMLPVVAFHYMIMAFGISVIFVVAEVLLSKNIKITVEEPADETNQTKEK